MSNLGWYQVLTTAAKKVGGPKRLVAMLFGSGVLTGVVGDKVYTTIKHSKEAREAENLKLKVFTVINEGKSNEGLVFHEGDKFRVLEVDNEAVLIEKMGDGNNPYFVAASFLKIISDFE